MYVVKENPDDSHVANDRVIEYRNSEHDVFQSRFLCSV